MIGTPPYDELGQWLAVEVPELAPLYEEHRADQQGEFLAHLFLGSYLAPWLKAAFERDGPSSLVRRVIAAVDVLASSDDERVVDAVHMSFFEWFAWPPEDRAVIESSLDLLGPASRRMMTLLGYPNSESR